MFSPTLLCNPTTPIFTPIFFFFFFSIRRSFPLKTRCFLHHQLRLLSGDLPTKSPVVADSLRLLEWDKLCDSVSSFSGTPLGQQAAKEQLWSTEVSYEKSKRLLEETAAAIELINYGARLDFSGVDVILVKSAIERVSRGIGVDGLEAMAVVNLILFAQSLHITVETAVKEDANYNNRFIPLTELSSELKFYRDQVRSVERKVTARAKYSIAFDGTFSGLFLPGDMDTNLGNSSVNKAFDKASFSNLSRKEWKVYMTKAYHPLLLQQHHESLYKARKDITNATADIRRRKLQGNKFTTEDDTDLHLAFLKLKIAKLEKDPPVPVEFAISAKTFVLVITGPNTG